MRRAGSQDSETRLVPFEREGHSRLRGERAQAIVAESARFDSQIQGLTNRPWIPAQIEYGDDYSSARLDHVVNAEIGSADDRPAKAFVFPREKFRVPFDPGHGIAEFRVKPVRSLELPRFVKGARVPEIRLDKLQKFDRLASHLRASRRSSSASEMRRARPA